MSLSLVILLAEDPKDHPVLIIAPVALLKVVSALCCLDAASTSPLGTFSVPRFKPAPQYASYCCPLAILHDLDYRKSLRRLAHVRGE